MTQRKEKVAYFYDSDVGGAYYGRNHPMKPHRICMTHHLVLAYGLHKHMDIFRSRRVDATEMLAFHDPAYIEYLATVNVENQASKDNNFDGKYLDFNMGEDCPVFDGLFDFCRLSTGASLDGAVRLNHGQCDIAINWSGGLHHAKKAQASGFCYTNDLVLAILELLKMHARVLYVDIDIHHGDGVEEAFYLCDRVMTVSFHQYGSNVFGNDTHVFFPGSGALEDVGEKRGKFYSMNVPLAAGATDSTFHSLFKPVMTKVVEVFNPTAIVMQSGADSLANDRLGGFNLTVDGHGEAVKFMKKFKLPMLVTGGGGYTKNNVARCWTNETAILVGEHLEEELPPNAYSEYYQPNNRLDRATLSRKPLDNYNTRARTDEIRETCMEYLRHLAHTPAVQMHYAPRANTLPEWDLEDEGDPDERMAQYARDHRLMEDYLHDYKQLDDDLAAARLA